MSKPVQKIHRLRRYGESFKRSLVQKYCSGQHTVRELTKLYGVSDHSIYAWIRKYSSYEKEDIIVIEHADSHLKKLKEQASRIASLEQSLGQKQMLIEYLEKLIELADEHFETDIKKNFDTKHFDGFKSTPRR